MKSKVDEFERHRSLLEEAKTVVTNIGGRMVVKRREGKICFYLPGGWRFSVWFPSDGRVRDLHVRDLEEVIVSVRKWSTAASYLGRPVA